MSRDDSVGGVGGFDVGTESENDVTSTRDRDLPVRRTLLGAFGTLVFLLVWQASAMAVARPFLLPSPLAVGTAFATELTAPAVFEVPLTNRSVPATRLVVKLLESLFHYVPGLVVGSVLGVATGVAMGWSRTLDAAFTPVTRVLRPIPPLAWIAFAIVWIGVNHGGAAFIVGIGAFWINFYSAYSGVEGVSTDLQEVAASLGVHDDVTMVRTSFSRPRRRRF
jgi:NitT/TauT family transport system permease protein